MSVPFVDKNIRADQAALQELLQLGFRATPVTVVEGEAVVGFDQAKLQKVLGGLGGLRSPQVAGEKEAGISKPQREWNCPFCGKNQVLQFGRCRFCGNSMAPSRCLERTTPVSRVVSALRRFCQCWPRPRNFFEYLAQVFAVGFAGVAVFGVLIVALGINTSSGPQRPDGPTDDTPKLEFTWTAGGFGNVMIADFAISNPKSSDIRDITITCVHSGASGTVLGSTTKTIYDVVPAKETRTFEHFNMGLIHSQARKARCSIATWR